MGRPRAPSPSPTAARSARRWTATALRPARWFVTDDDRVVMASEMGVLSIPEEKIVRKWRLQPGKMLLIDLVEGRIISDEEIKARLASAHPYRKWLARTQIVLEDLPAVQPPQPPCSPCSIASRPSATPRRT
ncbi:MAG: hypothetical protein M5U16_16380 [Hyphomicrobium sp.]|nr:hypothetical protein [Hyphomicrobium sp.]